MFSTEMKATCKNSANLEQETKTTKIVTYPLLSLASSIVYYILYNSQINVHALIGQSAMGYCAGKPMEKSRVF